MKPHGNGGVIGGVIAAGETLVSSIIGRAKLMAALSQYEKEPSGFGKLARDMTEQEGFDALMHLVFKGEIQMDETLKTNAAGKLIEPKPERKLKILATMGGIAYKHASNPKKLHFNTRPALAVALYRVALKFSGGYFRMTEIVWGGIGHGRNANDCHERGSCVDIYGGTCRFGVFAVDRHWGKRPVFKADGSRPEAVAGDRWGNATTTHYRLRETDSGMAYYFFRELYSVFREEFSADVTDPAELKDAVPIRRGNNIFHPDHPDISLRRNHQEHFHFQIGPSFY
jgi:hypothetical protein